MKASASRLLLISIVLFASLLGACSGTIADSPTAQPIRRVGMLHVGTDHVPPSLDTLVGRLAELGWIDGSQGELMASLADTRHGTRVRKRNAFASLQATQQNTCVDSCLR